MNTNTEYEYPMSADLMVLTSRCWPQDADLNVLTSSCWPRGAGQALDQTLVICFNYFSKLINTDNTKLLGVTLEENLSFKAHIDDMNVPKECTIRYLGGG